MPTSLTRYLTPATIRLQVSLETPEQAIDLAGRLLLSTSGIEERYIQAIKDLLVSAGPYMVITPGVALLHARPEHGALAECISLVTLKKPVEFGHMDNDPVYLVFAFAAGDKDIHLEVMSALAHLLSGTDRITRLAHARKLSTVQKMIQQADQEQKGKK
jgi:mannitol/fructose-specific phosphotransferase system IIA component (Ntr-type)